MRKVNINISTSTAMYHSLFASHTSQSFGSSTAFVEAVYYSMQWWWNEWQGTHECYENSNTEEWKNGNGIIQ